MNKKTITIVLVTALAVLILAPKLRQIPLVDKLPTL